MATVYLSQEDYDRFLSAMDCKPEPRRMLMGEKNYKEYIKDPKEYIENLTNELFKGNGKI